MEHDSFIESYVTAFLAARAERFYESCLTIRNPDYGWTNRQCVNDATELAEKAWASLKRSLPQYISETVGNAAIATTATASIPIMSSTPDTVDPTLSTTL